MVSNSRRTPWATPAASFINRAASAKNRLLVWVIGVSSASSNSTNNGDQPRPPQEQYRGICIVPNHHFQPHPEEPERSEGVSKDVAPSFETPRWARLLRMRSEWGI